MDKNNNQKLARRDETSLVNVSNQIATTNKILKSIRDNQLSLFSSFTDSRDGNVYKTVKIGEQVWMAENLRYIPHVGPITEYGGIWVYNYNGYIIREAISTEFYKEYGCLYDWETAKSVSPFGWHLPTDKEWEILTDYLGGENIAGGKLKEKGTKHWENPNEGASNETGFTALPGGYGFSGREFSFIGLVGLYWSSTEYDQDGAYCRDIGYRNSVVSRFYEGNKLAGWSIRCIRDTEKPHKAILRQEKEFEINENKFCLKIYSEFMEVTVHISIDRFTEILHRLGQGQFDLERSEIRLFIENLFHEKRDNIKFFNSKEDYYNFIRGYGIETGLDNNNCWFKKVVFMLPFKSYEEDLNSSIEYVKKMAQKNLD